MDDEVAGHGDHTAAGRVPSPPTGGAPPPTDGPAPPTELIPAVSERFDDRFDELAAVSYRVAYRILGSREDARDITQEALARAYARWPQVRDSAPAWVSRVSTNLALDLVRRRRRRPLPGTDRQPDPAAMIVARAELVDGLRRLPRRQRDVVVMRYLADLSERDVAAHLGCSAGTVKQHASRGLKALRSSWPEPVTEASPVPTPDEPPVATTRPGPLPAPDERPALDLADPDTNPKANP